MTDDSESPSVRRSDGWETLADRSGETSGGGGRGGKPGSFCLSILGDTSGAEGGEKKLTNSEALEWRPCCFWMIRRLILFNDVFKWDQMCSINLHLKLIVSIRRPSVIAKMASGAGANALTLHGYNERPNKTGL